MFINSGSGPEKSWQLTDVVWIQTSFIGDIVLTTAAMNTLAKLRPGIQQRLVTTPVGRAALAEHPNISSIHVVDKKRSFFASARDIGQELRNLPQSSTVILQAHKSLRSTLLARYLGFPVITYAETSLSILASHQVQRVAVLHEADRISLLLEGLGIDRGLIMGSRPWLPLMHDDLLQPLHDRKWIGIAPGSVWATKRWPQENFAKLTSQLLQDPSVGICIMGSNDEIEAAMEIQKTANLVNAAFAERIVDLTGKTSLKDLRSVYPRLSLIISNDSSPIHFGSAFNTPTLAIFGSTVPAMGFGPLANNSAVIETPMTCRPCGDHGPRSCPLGHFKCMKDISVSEVIKKARELVGL